jgi:inner membrane protein
MAAETPFASLSRSPVIRLLVVMFLAVILQIPVFMIEQLISERRVRRDTALEEVAGSWGRAQTVSGPVLVVPYTRRVRETTVDGKGIVREVGGRLRILPRTLAIEGRLAPQERRRGIFAIPVYEVDLALAGTFAPLDPASWPTAGDDISFEWEEAHVVVGVSDPRSIQEATALTWDGRTISFLPGSGTIAETTPSGIHAPLALAAPAAPGAAAARAAIPFRVPLRLHGSVGFRVVPVGEQTDVHLVSTWPSPSFKGAWLPARHTTGSAGFDARWSVPNLGRGLPSVLDDQRERRGSTTLNDLAFGVDLLAPVDTYRLSDRSVKYAFLFIVFTLGFLWLVEVLMGVPVHPVQLLLVGSALCIFYLLELSLAEHIGFRPAYLVATAAIVGMITAYAAAFLRSWRRAALLGAAVAGLYAYLYIVLINEDAALLVGSIGLFVALGAVMYLTRRVDWSRGGGGRLPTPEEAGG